jgi:hypothetical protein
MYFVGRLVILKHPVVVVFTQHLIIPVQPQHIAILQREDSETVCAKRGYSVVVIYLQARRLCGNAPDFQLGCPLGEPSPTCLLTRPLPPAQPSHRYSRRLHIQGYYE